MPSAAALERGSEAGRLIVESHRAQNGGAFPETVAVNLWGLDAIKTKGESVAIVLHLVGARPVREGAEFFWRQHAHRRLTVAPTGNLGEVTLACFGVRATTSRTRGGSRE